MVELDEEEDRTHRILCKAVVVQALYAVYEDRVSWDVVLIVDDLAGFGKTAVRLPRDCLDKQKLYKFIEEIKKKEV